MWKMWHSIVAVCLSDLVAAGHSLHGEALQDSADSVLDRLLDKASFKLLSRAFNESTLHHTDIDETVLGKPSHFAISSPRIASSSAFPDRFGHQLAPKLGGQMRLGPTGLSQQKLTASPAFTFEAPPRSAVQSAALPRPLEEAYGRPRIEWYPGHIGAAERRMAEILRMVDVVIDLRDARVPDSTTHPLLPSWISQFGGHRERVVVLNRMDQVPPVAGQAWTKALANKGIKAFLVDAKSGKGVDSLRKYVVGLGDKVNAKRFRRGLKGRPVRAAVLGYPNIGKSALINRLLGKVRAKSENRPGVTRKFNWVMIDRDLWLMDTPGIIPARQVSQTAAYHLAMCGDISDAAFDYPSVAATLFETLVNINTVRSNFADLSRLKKRYGLSPEDYDSGDYWIQDLTDNRFAGDMQRASTAFLYDFQRGSLGPTCIEIPALYKE
eukprot:gnl/TRDRNA2_/TRDRNA2_87314_c0_seq1.p1 gnl/TRDRNA2_/TRDRNA2_87314_c0~~gnl/TRDRNA2_/TRDRNA2_87314_c0_seq1.p1  ORF type:complete len:438 (+),score=50.10 gnl/TRDRNA2_/TRDRNA2_87314_c0_seq1:65-1378(+)